MPLDAQGAAVRGWRRPIGTLLILTPLLVLVGLGLLGVQKFSVQLWGESDEINLSVSDSGVGFDLRAARRGRGLGLIRIEQRVNLVEGTFSIDSQPEKGTTVHVSLPLHSGNDSKRAAG
jgi:signal transduction histidine kinase